MYTDALFVQDNKGDTPLHKIRSRLSSESIEHMIQSCDQAQLSELLRKKYKVKRTAFNGVWKYLCRQEDTVTDGDLDSHRANLRILQTLVNHYVDERCDASCLEDIFETLSMVSLTPMRCSYLRVLLPIMQDGKPLCRFCRLGDYSRLKFFFSLFSKILWIPQAVLCLVATLQ